MRNRWLALAAALLVLTGCAAPDTPDPVTTPPPTTTTTTSATTSTTTTTTTTTTPPPPPRAVDLEADVRNGTAPLPVTFTLDAEGPAPTRWTIEFGDGDETEGTAFPATFAHNYTQAGTFVAQATVHYSSGPTAEDSLSIGVLPADSGPAGYRLNATTDVQAPVGIAGIGCLRGLVDPANPALCAPDQAKAAFEQDAATNGTWFRWYAFNVTAGASALAVHAGSHANQTCQETPELPVAGAVGACSPDFDVYLLDPQGEWNVTGTSAGFEETVIPAPAAGAWALVVIYFAGPPDHEMEARLEVML